MRDFLAAVGAGALVLVLFVLCCVPLHQPTTMAQARAQAEQYLRSLQLMPVSVQCGKNGSWTCVARLPDTVVSLACDADECWEMKQVMELY